MKSNSLKLSLMGSGNGTRYLRMLNSGFDHSVLLREGLTVPESLRADAQATREKAAKLTRDADLYEQAACQYEAENRCRKDAEVTLYAGTVADALERHLNEAGTSVHWVRAVGEESSWAPSRVTWPSDPALSYQVQQGLSEGSLVYVMLQLDPREPAAVRRLLTVKLLCAGAKAYAECALISAFLDKLNPADLMAAQARIWKKSA